MNRGSCWGLRSPFLLVLASMRPRFMNRGSAFMQRHYLTEKQVASMRPRFMNRGSAHPCEQVNLDVAMLQ